MNMHIKVTATEANRSFSRLLREVAKGKRVSITSHGTEVAMLAPVESAEEKAALRAKRLKALAALREDWAKQPHITIGPWTRDDLYSRDW